jgi:hypothetical protein
VRALSASRAIVTKRQVLASAFGGCRVRRGLSRYIGLYEPTLSFWLGETLASISGAGGGEYICLFAPTWRRLGRSLAATLRGLAAKWAQLGRGLCAICTNLQSKNMQITESANQKTCFFLQKNVHSSKKNVHKS